MLLCVRHYARSWTVHSFFYVTPVIDQAGRIKYLERYFNLPSDTNLHTVPHIAVHEAIEKFR